MDPSYEERLRDEVIYLHSLWRKGPPGRNPNPRLPQSSPLQFLHQPLNPPFFKNPNFTSKTSRNNIYKRNKIEFKDPVPESSDLQWQTEKTPEEETPISPSGWPSLKLPQSKTRQVSAEDQAKLVPTQMQQKGLEAARVFFKQRNGSDCEDDDEDEEMDGDDDGCKECEEHAFFMKLFTEDGDLRGYYEKNSESGDFYCLVCNGIGKKVWKKYKNCVAVVQHSIAISKTAKRRAHRAYGQVICKVLGWDISRLPTVVLSLDSTLSQSLAKVDNSQIDANGITDDDINKFKNKEEDANVCSDTGLPECSTSSFNVDTSESIAAESETVPKEGEANTHVEESGEGVPVSAANVEELMNCSGNTEEM